jgi:hypothetical protein
MMNDFFEAQLREAYALRDGVVLDPAKFPEVTQDEAGFFRVGGWAFDLVEDGDPDKVLQDLHTWGAWYRFIVSKQPKKGRVTG